MEQHKRAASLKKPSNVRSESETQTAVAVRVPSIKKEKVVDKEAMEAAEKIVTSEQAHNASVARKRRLITKNRAQGVRTREKTPEPSRTPAPHEDTTTTDEEDSRAPRSPSEEADDIYLEMRRKLQEKKREKDADDIDIHEIRSKQEEVARERRRRSISPFAIPTNEEIEGLQRKGSFIDPGNKLLSTAPVYGLSPKEDSDSSRKNSLNLDMDPQRKSSLTVPPSPTSPVQQKSAFQLSTPPNPKKQQPAAPVKNNTALNQRKETNPPKLQQTAQAKPPNSSAKPKQSSLKMSTNTNTANISKPEPPAPQPTQPAEAPVKPKRSKSATRSQGRTSESEMSEDQNKPKVENQPPQKPPKPKERRRTIAAIKRNVRERSETKRAQSATRTDVPLDTTGIEMTKASSEIIDLLEKARQRSVSVPDDDLKTAIVNRTDVDRSRQLMTPKKTPSTPKKTRGISCPKTIKILSPEERMESFKKAQRKSMEMELSRRSSGYIDASQSEVTSSCYSSSNSEDDSDFDLRKKAAELTKKLTLLHSEKQAESDMEKEKNMETDTKEADAKRVDTKEVETKQPDTKEPDTNELENNKPEVKEEEIKEKVVKSKEPKPKSKKTKQTEPKEKIKEDVKQDLDPCGDLECAAVQPTRMLKLKVMRQNCRRVWKAFKVEQGKECVTIKSLRNRCFSDMLILIIFCGLGGFVFRYTEGAFENFYKCGVRRVKRDFIDTLWQGSHNLREDDWKSMARKKLWEFETQLHTAHEAGVHSYSGQKNWSFMNAIVYCLTVVTTIGYGHIAPSTTTGRAITIVYAVFGIPLFLILLADFGKLFTRCIKFVWAFVRRLYYTGSCRKVRRTVQVQEVMRGINMVYTAASTFRRPSQNPVDEEGGEAGEAGPPMLPPKPSTPGSGLAGEEGIVDDPQTPAPSVFEIDDEFNLPISVAIVCLIIYIFMGASIYVVWEEWGFFESFYFVFISMSTIGFGDFVPNHPIYMMGSIVYLVFGMALTSMCINVVQLKLSETFRQASAKIGATIGLRVSDEDGSLAPVTPAPVEIAAVHGAAIASPEADEPA